MAGTSTDHGSRVPLWGGPVLRASGRAAVSWREIPTPGAILAPEPDEPMAEPEPVPAAPLGFDETDLARVCASVAATVRAEVLQAAMDRDAKRIADALERIAQSLDQADAILAERRRQFREAASILAAAATEALALGPGVKVAARLADALVADCLARFDPDLALTVEVAPDIVDALAARLAASPVVKARPGRVAVEAAGDIGPGEVRLVWADGAADWSAERLHADAAALIRRLTEPTRPSPSMETEQA
jgi:hypothetical protein